MQDTRIDYLSTIQVLQDLAPDELLKLERQMTMATCSAGKVFYSPDESGEVLFLLRRGQVRLYRLSPDGKKLVMATLGPGAMFGQMALVGQSMYHTFAEAAGECVIGVMSRSEMERLSKKMPKVALRFAEAQRARLSDPAEQEPG